MNLVLRSRLVLAVLASGLAHVGCSGALIDVGQRQVQCPDDDAWAESPYTDGTTYFKGICPGQCTATLPHCDLDEEEVCERAPDRPNGSCVSMADAANVCTALAAELPDGVTAEGLAVFDARFAERFTDEPDLLGNIEFFVPDGERCFWLEFGARDRGVRLPGPADDQDPIIEMIELAVAPSTDVLSIELEDAIPLGGNALGVQWTVYFATVCVPADDFPSEIAMQLVLPSGGRSNPACVIRSETSTVEDHIDELWGQSAFP